MTAALSAEAPVLTAAHAVTLSPCGSDGCGGHAMSDGWSVCLAVLTGLGLLVVAATLLLSRRIRDHVLAALAAVKALDGAPPPRRPAGLLLTSATVLRI
jgi:hypothetical protein